MDNKEIIIYGDRDEVRELSERLKRFLPSGKRMTEADALSFAQIAIAQGLNPFAREIWYIPGIGTVTGIEGYRKSARKQSTYSANLRLMTSQEAEAHALGAQDVGAICEIYRHDVLQRAVEINKAAGAEIIPIRPVEGVGIWRKGENIPKGKSALWVAQKRAEADGLRKAFDLVVGYADNGDEPVVMETTEIKTVTAGEAIKELYGEPEWDDELFEAGEDEEEASESKADAPDGNNDDDCATIFIQELREALNNHPRGGDPAPAGTLKSAKTALERIVGEGNVPALIRAVYGCEWEEATLGMVAILTNTASSNAEMMVAIVGGAEEQAE